MILRSQFRAQITATAMVTFVCFTVAGCIYIPVKELSPPSQRAYEWQKTGTVRNVPFDIRTACGRDRPIHVGMSRDEVHALIGQPDDRSDTRQGPPAKGESEEHFEFIGMTEYFYILGENPVGTHTYLTEYMLTIEYDPGNRVSKCHVSKDSGVGLLWL